MNAANGSVGVNAAKGSVGVNAANGSVVSAAASPPEPEASAEAVEVFVTLCVAGQLCGLPVRRVRDVLEPQSITRIPLALPEIAGSLNLRGKIVTAISLRRRLGLPPAEADAPCMSIVTEQGSELYALLVDQVSEVLTLPASGIAPVPPTLPHAWRHLSAGVHRLADRLLVVLDLERVLDLAPSEA